MKVMGIVLGLALGLAVVAGRNLETQIVESAKSLDGWTSVTLAEAKPDLQQKQ